MVLLLNFLNSIGTDGSFGNQDSENSVLSAASKEFTVLFSPMGIKEDNWPAVVGVVSGVLAKEVVVGTLDNLYTSLSENGTKQVAEFDLWQALSNAAATVPQNLSGIINLLTDPLGMNVGDVANTQLAAEQQKVNSGTFGAMAQRFDGQKGAFAYLLFVLMYFPCIATMAVIKREAGRTWGTFVAFWTTSLAYITASLFYQISTFSKHPATTSLTIGFMGLFLFCIVFGLWYWARKESNLRPIALSIQE